MPACCPNCGSVESVGVEAASLCTECASATVAGATFSVPMLVAGAAIAVASVLVARCLTRLGSGRSAALA